MYAKVKSPFRNIPARKQHAIAVIGESESAHMTDQMLAAIPPVRLVVGSEHHDAVL
ncbi:MAG: hypothetical protein JRE71_03550 [Deltaproteobacteria bacterium]|nr:hypothetical protein [Deltaproteobacteria bacterium]